MGCCSYITGLSVMALGLVLCTASPTEPTYHVSGTHRSRHMHHQIHTLQEQLDRFTLRQRTDHIYINNLKRKIAEIEKRLDSNKYDESVVVLSPTLDDTKISTHSDEVLEKRTQQEPADENEQTNQSQKLIDSKSILHERSNTDLEQLGLDSVLELRKNFLQLKAEMETLKTLCQKNHNPPHSTREENALSWILREVPRLQGSVRELQESTNLLQEMHKQKETELKMSALSSALNSIQQTLIKLTTKVESTAAVADTLTQELSQHSTELHETEMKVMHAEGKLGEQEESLDTLLKALPDGILQDKASTDIVRHLLSGEPERVGSLRLLPSGKIERIDSDAEERKDMASRIDNLELKSSSLDFALLNLQKKVFSLSTENKTTANSSVATSVHEHSDPRAEDELTGVETLTKRLELIEDELAKMKKASASLVKMMSDVEEGDDEATGKLLKNLSQVEVKLEQERQDRLEDEVDAKNSRREMEDEEHSDIFEFKRILNSVSDRLRSLETKCHAHHTAGEEKMAPETFVNLDPSERCFDSLQNRINETEKRVSILENIAHHYNRFSFPEQNLDSDTGSADQTGSSVHYDGHYDNGSENVDSSPATVSGRRHKHHTLKHKTREHHHKRRHGDAGFS